MKANDTTELCVERFSTAYMLVRVDDAEPTADCFPIKHGVTKRQGIALAKHIATTTGEPIWSDGKQHQQRTL